MNIEVSATQKAALQLDVEQTIFPTNGNPRIAVFNEMSCLMNESNRIRKAFILAQEVDALKRKSQKRHRKTQTSSGRAARA